MQNYKDNKSIQITTKIEYVKIELDARRGNGIS